MRWWTIALCAAAIAAVAPAATHTVLASAAAIVLESLPYMAGAELLSRFAGRFATRVGPYLGCGCGTTGGARSILGAVATAAIFGVPVALARLAVAVAVVRLRRPIEHEHPASLCGNLVALAPAAVAAGVVSAIVPSLPLHSFPPAIAFAAGIAIGAFASPCLLGAVALAGALHSPAPYVAGGILATAGIVSVYPRTSHRFYENDRVSCALLAVACAVVAWQHGAQLVNPRLVYPLWCCAFYCAVLAYRSRSCAASTLRSIATAIVIATIAGVPQPAYVATETTLADAFAGERVVFAGAAVTRGGRTALVRYAIACCRADASPVAVLLDRRAGRGEWIRAEGTLRQCGAELCLHADRLDAVAPPSDPYIYL